jgi:hypothetical protein
MTALRLSAGLLLLLLPTTASGQQPVRGRGEVRKTLERILASPEFETRIPKLDAKESIWRWISRKLGELFDSLSQLGNAASPIFWAVLAICAVLLTGIFIHGGIIVVRALRASRGRSGPPVKKGVRAEDAEALLAQAASAAERRQFTEAIRLCHRAALLGLDRRGLVRFQECLTNGDYRGQLQSHDAERSLFLALIRIYEPAFFGNASTSDAEYSETLQLARRLQQGAPS